MSKELNEAARIRYLEAELRELAKSIATGVAGKIHAIKAYRASTGEGLKESKDWVEALAIGAPGFADSRIQRLEDRVTMLERNTTYAKSV